MNHHVLTTGIESLDRLLGGVRGGDNIVWEVDSGAHVDAFVRGFLKTARETARQLVFVSLNCSPQAILKKYLGHISSESFVLVDCFTSGKGNGDRIFSDFYASQSERPPATNGQPSFRGLRVFGRSTAAPSGGELAGEEGKTAEGGMTAVHVHEVREPEKVKQAIEDVESQFGRNALYVFDSVTGMLELWNDERKVLNFFTFMCPRLYDLNTIAYWILEKQAHSEQFLANLRHVTQVVVELSIFEGRPVLLVRKAEGRTTARIGIPQSLTITDGTVEMAREHREELEVAILSDVSEAIGRAMDLKKVFEQTMEILARELRMKRGTLVLLNRATNELKIVAAHGLSEEEKQRGRYRVGEGVTGRVVQTGQPVAVADVKKEPAFLDRTGARAQEKLRGQVSFVCVPLRVDGEVLGAISIDRDFVDEQTLAKDQRLLQIIASLVSQAIKINRTVTVEREQLLAENLRLLKDLRSKYRFGNIVAASGAMQEVIATAATIAKGNTTVLIRGDTGTGKELIASVLHYNSNRASGPFVKVNCGALPETLLETELFGHVRGAFTGAVEDRKGRFELAHKGTIFLDEVGGMSPRLQVRLLRVLQEKEFERVGGTQTVKVDARVVAATNADLEGMVAKGAFREDLFYRLNVIPIFIPPLRERREDIPFLVEHFLEKYSRETGKNVSKISQEVFDVLTEYKWPGNVRELESCIERAVVLAEGGTITASLLPIHIRAKHAGRKPPLLGSDVEPRLPAEAAHPEELISRLLQALRRQSPAGLLGIYRHVITQVEKSLLTDVLSRHDFVQTRAAKELGLSRNTLRAKIKGLGIPGPAADGS